MSPRATFAGFSMQCPRFLRQLRKNNTKVWFEAHRDEYERFVLDPSREFVVALGERLSRIAPAVHADPRANRSIFRIYRDTRFSRDKSPYKTHLGLWFWEGEGPRMECSGFYFHLDPPKLLLGAGIYRLPPHLLEAYRNDLVHKRHGADFSRMITRTTRNPNLTIGGQHYKRVPRGFDPDHKSAPYLLHHGLYVGLEMGIPKELYSKDAVGTCYRHYRKMLPMHSWLLAMTRRRAK